MLLKPSGLAALYKSNTFTFTFTCFGAFPFDSCFEMHLQNGSIFCISRSASNLSADKDLGIVFCVSVMSGAMEFVCDVESLDELC